MLESVRADSLTAELARIRAVAVRHVGSAAALEAKLGEIIALLLAIDLSRHDARAIERDAHPLIIGLFDVRMMLHDELLTWHRLGYTSRTAISRMRDVMRISRYATDMLGEIAIRHRTLPEGQTTWRAFTGPDFNTLGHPSLASGAKIPFEAGDVLLMRGMAANSAAIARIGDADSQFSHVGIVHVDESCRYQVVEALIEDGAVIKPLDEVLDQDLGRCIVLRHKDANLARLAARRIHDHVAATLTNDGTGSVIYDFSMEIKGYKRLYCSKLIRQAFDLASDGKVLLPTFKTSLFMKNRDFFRRIGVTATETFAPADLEVEPDFHIVAEWADYRKTPELRLADIAMDKFFEWMDKYQYRFHETLLVHFIAIGGRMASRLSNRAKTLIADVIPKTPAQMSRRTIGTIAMLHQTTKNVVDELRVIDRRARETTGLPLLPHQLAALVEQIREREGGRVGYLRAP